MATPLPDRLRILFVDDELGLQKILKTELEHLGHEVTVCPDGTTALKVIQSATFDAAILDLKMPDMTGIDVLAYLKRAAPDTEAVMMTGYATKETAVEALRLGAFDYIEKPCKLTDIEGLLLRIQQKRRLKHENLALRTRVQAAEGRGNMIGNSPAMLPVSRLIQTVAPTDSTVLILGETGTGKDVVARTIYELSDRSDRPFVPVNCGALTDQLAESELFGHVKGAFSGAEKDHKGLFEVANGGTLFLDEVGELSKNIQVKLLRFLEIGEIRRVGDNKPLQTDVRVLCATNRDLRAMVANDDFREDLLYRLNTFEVSLPPLRDRLADLPELARNLLARAAKRPVEQVAGLLTPQVLDAMTEYAWPGNVRELANAMEYAYIMGGGGSIEENHLPHSVRAGRGQAIRPSPSRPATESPAPVPPPPSSGPKTLRDIEMEHILRVLEKNNGQKKVAAEELGVSLKTLYNKLNAYEEERRRFAS